jgi:hypothetical protein
VKVVPILPQVVFIRTYPTGGLVHPDLLAFSLIVFLASRSGATRLKIPTILGTIAADATLYFMVIFTSHFVLTMTLVFGRVRAIAPIFGLQSAIISLCLPRTRSNFFQPRKSLPTLTATTLMTLFITTISGNVV